MVVSEFELIVLESGDIGLQQVGESDLLVRVKFSADVKQYLGNQQLDVAKIMIDSGIRAVIELEKSQRTQETDPSSTIH
jgi:hypothetical protein